LLLLRDDRPAGKTLARGRFAQGWIECDPLVEDEALSLPVGATNFFEVFQNAAVELNDMFNPGVGHEKRRLLAAYSTSAKCHYAFVAQQGRSGSDRLRELGEMANMKLMRVDKTT